jgi:SsrA-binding protein
MAQLIKEIASNRKAFHEYIISDKVEAGLVLTGTEVKSARLGKVSLTDGWVDFGSGEAYLCDTHIAKYSHGSYLNHEETRPRKLLLKKSELARLAAKVEEKGFTVVPLRLYFKDQFIKLEIGVGKGKKLHDKRESAKEREAGREMQRALRSRGGD